MGNWRIYVFPCVCKGQMNTGVNEYCLLVSADMANPCFLMPPLELHTWVSQQMFVVGSEVVNRKLQSKSVGTMQIELQTRDLHL